MSEFNNFNSLCKFITLIVCRLYTCTMATYIKDLSTFQKETTR